MVSISVVEDTNLLNWHRVGIREAISDDNPHVWVELDATGRQPFAWDLLDHDPLAVGLDEEH